MRERKFIKNNVYWKNIPSSHSSLESHYHVFTLSLKKKNFHASHYTFSKDLIARAQTTCSFVINGNYLKNQFF